METPVTIGLSKVSLADTFAGSKPESFYQDLEARVLFVHALADTTVLIALDLVALSRSFVEQLQKRLCSTTGLPSTAIAIHTTHTHTSSAFDGPFLEKGIDTLVSRLSEGIQCASAASQPAQIAYREADIGSTFSINERKVVGDIGAFECWYGFKVLNGAADAAHIIRRRATEIAERPMDTQLPKTVLFDNPVDTRAQLLVFKSVSGQDLGSLFRFAVHPIVSGHVNATEKWRLGPDIPGFARRAIESRFGPTCIYLSGPHANITAFEQVDWSEERWQEYPKGHRHAGSALKEAERLGNGIAAAFLERVNGPLQFQPLTSFAYRTFPTELPIRNTFLVSEVEKSRQRNHLQEMLDRSRTNEDSLKQLKALYEQIKHLDMHSLMLGAGRFLSPEEISSQTINYTHFGLRLNNHLLLGLPGETFFETGQNVKGINKRYNVITVSHVNGNIGYIPPPDQYAQGGYHAYNCILDPSGEPMLRNNLRNLAESLVDLSRTVL